jgi:hypothetical protein
MSQKVASLLEECQVNGIEPIKIEPVCLREQLGSYYYNKEHPKPNTCRFRKGDNAKISNDPYRNSVDAKVINTECSDNGKWFIEVTFTKTGKEEETKWVEERTLGSSSGISRGFKTSYTPEQYYFEYHQRQRDNAVAVKVEAIKANAAAFAIAAKVEAIKANAAALAATSSRTMLAALALAEAPAAPAAAASAPARVGRVGSWEKLSAAQTIVKAMTMFESQFESQLEQVKKMLEEDKMQQVPLLVIALEEILRETSESIRTRQRLLLSMLQSSYDSDENGGEWL